MADRNLSLKEIDTSNFPFSFTNRNDNRALADSIRRVGMLNPPVLFRQTKGRLLSVARGARRVRAAVMLGLGTIAARISSDTDPLTLLTASIHENALERNLTHSEKARALQLLLKLGVEREQALREFLPLMGTPSSPFWFDYLKALSGLPAEFQAAADAGRLSHKMILFVSDRPQNEAGILFQWITDLKLNMNQQRIMVELLNDMIDFKGLSLKAVMEYQAIKDAIEGPGHSLTGRGGRLIKALSRARNPGLAEMEKSFDENVKRMSLPLSVSVSHHPAFERSQVTLRMTWRSPKEARFILEKLNRAEQEGLIDNLMESV